MFSPLKQLGFAGCLTFICHFVFSQTVYTISGKVTDANSGDPVPFASVALKGTTIGTTTSFEGNFTIKTQKLSDSLLVTSVGFASRSKAITASLNQTINVQLLPTSTQLKEVVVNSGENPAFPILRKVRENRGKNDKKHLSAYQYEAYSKTEIDVDNLSEKFRKKKAIQKITKVIDEFEKIAGEDGKPVLPMFVSESVSDVYYRDSPQRKKEFIKKTKVSGVGVKDGSLVSQLIGNSFLDLNFYNNYLTILNKDFASPIGDDWKNMYEWFLADSVMVDTNYCYELEFEPKRKQDLAFTGKLWIDKKTHALLQIDVVVNKDANLNYIEKIKIQQELAQTSEGAWLPSKSRFVFDIAEFSKNTAGMLAKFYVSNRNFVVNQSKELSFYDVPIEVAEDSKESNKAYWDQNRHEPLSKEDNQALAMIDSVKNIPVVRTYVEITDIAVNGWKKVGIIDVGPYLNLFAYNQVEGFRTRLGFRTNFDFSKKWVARGFLGYGTADGKFKYGIEMNRIISRKHWTIIGASHSFDVERVGITQDLIGNNKLFYAFTRFRSRGSFYQTENKVYIKAEPMKGIMLSATLAGQHFNPSGLPYYNFGYYPEGKPNDNKDLKSEFQDTRLELEARFARHETFIMDGNERITIGTKRIPVLTFRYTKGLRNVFGGNFDYNKFTLTAFQSLHLGQFGRSTYRLSLGYTPSDIPYPLLFTHLGSSRRNPFYNRFAFNMMGFFEFVSDKYASIMWEHNFEGLLFNRIPAIKKLKWRFLATANVLYGSERSENKNVVPSTDSGDNRILEFGSLKPNVPYVEVGYGIDNIFKVFRINFNHRLTYLDKQGVKPFGIKGSVHFSF